MISKVFSLRNYIMKQLMKPNKQGIMQIPDKGKVDFGEMIIKEDLFKKGIDPKTITSETQLDTILNTPHAPTKPKNPPTFANRSKRENNSLEISLILKVEDGFKSLIIFFNI